MLPQEIRDIIEDEAGKSIYFKGAYSAAATKYAELMIEFAEWMEDNVIGTEQGKWSSFDSEETRSYNTSDLLIIFLKEKSNLANENNIV